MAIHTRFCDGVYLNTDFGVCITTDSPIWDMADTEMASAIRKAKDRHLWLLRFEQLEWVYDNSDCSMCVQIEILREDPDLLDAIVTSDANPYARHYHKNAVRLFLMRLLIRQLELRARKTPTREQRKYIFDRDRGKCRYCGEPAGADRQIDHVVPFSLRGPTVTTNLVLCCRRCNQKKRARTPEQAGMRLIPLEELDD